MGKFHCLGEQGVAALAGLMVVDDGVDDDLAELEFGGDMEEFGADFVGGADEVARPLTDFGEAGKAVEG